MANKPRREWHRLCFATARHNLAHRPSIPLSCAASLLCTLSLRERKKSRPLFAYCLFNRAWHGRQITSRRNHNGARTKCYNETSSCAGRHLTAEVRSSQGKSLIRRIRTQEGKRNTQKKKQTHQKGMRR